MSIEIKGMMANQGFELKDRCGTGHTVRFYDPQSISFDERERILAQLTPLTGLGFMRKDIYSNELYRDVENHVLGSERLVIGRIHENISVYIVSDLKTLPSGERIYHLGGLICDPKYQHSGISEYLLRLEVFQNESDILAFHTQSELMRKLGLKIAYLNPSDSLHVASLIGTKCQDGIVDKGRYGGKCLYEDSERFGPIAIKEIDYLAGDALICAGPIKRMRFF